MKNLKDIAEFMKSNVVGQIPEDYRISAELTDIYCEDDIRKGIKAFQSFLRHYFDNFISNADEYPQNETDKTTLAFDKMFPELIQPLFMLYSIGLRGSYDSQLKQILIDGNDLNEIFKELHGNKPNQYLSELSDLGFAFPNIKILDKSFKLTKAGLIEIHYPDAPYMLAGIKALVEATAHLSKRYTDKNSIFAIFIRCDYHALTLPKKFSVNMYDCVSVAQPEYRSFFIGLHEILISSGCKFDVKYLMNEHVFTYTSKIAKTVMFSIHMGLEGCYVKLNSKLISSDPALLSEAPDGIVNAVVNGIGCAKAKAPNACNPKCNNIRFTLDGKEYQKCKCLNFNLPIGKTEDREYITAWLHKELAALV